MTESHFELLNAPSGAVAELSTIARYKVIKRDLGVLRARMLWMKPDIL